MADNIIHAKNTFSNFRNLNMYDYQYDTVKKVLKSDAKYIFINAPTGSGKSLIGACLCETYDRTAYLVHSKSLQQQLQSDFPEFKILMGRSNYECIESNGNPLNCAQCKFSDQTKCPSKHGCIYKIEKNKAVHAHLRGLNYAYMFAEANNVGYFSNQDSIICDEADTLEPELLSSIRLTISERMMDKYELPPIPCQTTGSKDAKVEWAGVDKWIIWAEAAMDKLLIHERILSNKIESAEESHQEVDEYILKRQKQLQNTINRLKLFLKHVDHKWLLDTNDGKFGKTHEFTPTWLTPELSEGFFFRYGEKFIMMSATLMNHRAMCHVLGIDIDESEYISIPSTFPIKYRPIYTDAVGDLSAKTYDRDIPLIIEEIKRLMAKHPNEKGLIHTFNYKISKRIMDEIWADRLITHDGSNKIEQIKLFNKSDKPLVMVSPSMDRGVSLNDDLCRFIIQAKCPFKYLGNKQTQARMYSGSMGKLWYKSDAIQTLEQAAGRGMRWAGDSCAVYIIDKAAERLIFDNLGLFSEYFVDCLV